MRYAYDIMHGEDWGDGPVFESGYDYPSPLAALDAALEIIDREGWREDDAAAAVTGVYVYGEQDDSGDGPQWDWTPQMVGGPILSDMVGTDDIYQ